MSFIHNDGWGFFLFNKKCHLDRRERSTFLIVDYVDFLPSLYTTEFTRNDRMAMKSVLCESRGPGEKRDGLLRLDPHLRGDQLGEGVREGA